MNFITKTILVIILIITNLHFSFCQIDVVWQKCIGGSTTDLSESICLTNDNCIVVAGYTMSSDGDFNANYGSSDFAIVKLDFWGNLLWARNYGGSNGDSAQKCKQTSDGGFIVIGSTASNDGDCTQFFGTTDWWVIKLDSNGDLIWQKSIGGASWETCLDVIELSTGEFLVVGNTISGEFYDLKGYQDALMVKLSSDGNIVWQKCFGGSDYESFNGICKTYDGCVVAVGYSKSHDYDVSANNGGSDYWVVKLNESGDILWEKNYGGSSLDVAADVIQLRDSSFIIVGRSESNDGDIVGNNGASDCVIFKLDTLGNAIWNKNYGGPGIDEIVCVKQTSDGGIILSGHTNSTGGDISQNYGVTDGIVLKLDSIGDFQWLKNIGGSSADRISGVVESPDGALFITAFTNSNDYDVNGIHGDFDIWVAKIRERNIFGYVYNDLNSNCIKDFGEPLLPGHNLVLSPNDIYVQTNEYGYYILDSLSEGTYNISVDTTNALWEYNCINNLEFTVIDSVSTTLAPNFGMSSTIPCTNPDISIYISTFRPCFSNQKIYLNASNLITATEPISGATAIVEFDSLLTIDSASLLFSNLGNNTYSFYLGTINPGQSKIVEINTTVSCDAIVGETLCVTAELYPVDECTYNLDSLPNHPAGNWGFLPECTQAWDSSSLYVNGWCQGNFVRFDVINGDENTGDMVCYTPVRIFMDGQFIQFDSVKLQGGEIKSYSFEAIGETWRLEVDQHPMHPGYSQPNAVVELCGGDSNWQSGMLNEQYEDDMDPYVDICCQIATSSFDPNDKQAFPSGIGNEFNIYPNQQLQYAIRFQNTGTDTAFNVIIRDTLSENLNIFSVIPGVSSHPYTFRIYGQRVLEWEFENILLPDSSTNESASQGFVTFKVDQELDLPFGTVIENSASIYFDFNDPIITNTTVHTIDDFYFDFPNSHLLYPRSKDIKIYPNPANTAVSVSFPQTNYDSKLFILNIYGKIMSSYFIPSKSTSFKINLDNYSSGMYFLKFESSDNFEVEKIIIEKE